MKVYLEPKTNSFGINRVVKALTKYLPKNIEITKSEDDADLIVLHVIGRNEHVTKQAESILEQGKQYSVIQYVLQSSRNPNPQDWYKLWGGSNVVWSYYDLGKHIEHFYHAPLSVEDGIFYPESSVEKRYTVGTIGNCYKAECVGENQLATWKVGGKAFHVGDRFNSDIFVDYMTDVTDNQLRVLYNSCRYFSALRRDDGFEIPAIESLLCGVRPIMFDTPNYRQWFDGGLVEFIPEVPPGELVGKLKQLFKKEPRPVTSEEILETKNRFNWESIIKGFWEKCTI